MWWASVGLVACEWAGGKNGGEEHFPIIEDLSEERYNGHTSILITMYPFYCLCIYFAIYTSIFCSFCSTPVPTALHLAFKAQRLHRQSATPPPLSVINQLCASASHSLKTCDQNMASEDHLHLVSYRIMILLILYIYMPTCILLFCWLCINLYLLTVLFILLIM